MATTQNSALVSVIIPCYNGGDYISAAIGSVLAQSYKNWELLVIDDGSTDGSKDIVKKYLNDKRITLLENKKNLGIARTKNRGIKDSKGELLAFLDQDDIWEKDKLTLQAARLGQEPGVGVVCCAVAFTDLDFKKTTVFPGFDDSDQQELIKNLYITPINSSSVMMIRRSSLSKMGLFDEGLQGWDDYELLMRLGKSFKIRYERGLLVNKRIHPGGAQHRPGVLAEEDRVFESLLKMHPFLSKYKDMREATRFFDRSIELVRTGDTAGARSFAKKSLSAKPSPSRLVLYFITLLPAPLARSLVAIIFSFAGKAKLISSSRTQGCHKETR